MDQTLSPLPGSQGLDNVHKQRVAEVLNDPENMEKRRSRESLNVDVVKYESGPDGGEEVSMSVEWNGVSTVHSRRHARPGALSPRPPAAAWASVLQGCLPALSSCLMCQTLSCSQIACKIKIFVSFYLLLMMKSVICLKW